MNVHYGDGGDRWKINIGEDSATTKRRTFAYKKASMHGKKAGRPEAKKRWCNVAQQKIVRTKAKKEGAVHSIPVFWDPVVLAFDQNFLIFFRLFLLVGNSLLLTRSFQILWEYTFLRAQPYDYRAGKYPQKHFSTRATATDSDWSSYRNQNHFCKNWPYWNAK